MRKSLPVVVSICGILLGLGIIAHGEEIVRLCKAAEESFDSRKYGKVQLLVVTPPGYEDGNLRYPVLYWLHGSGGNRKFVLSCLAELPLQIDETKKMYFWEKSIRKTSLAIEQKIIPPVIIIGCEAPRGDWKPEDMGLVTEEIIAYVDKRYRTIPEQRGRSIEGFSKGSEALSYYVTERPELYASASMLCGAWGEKRWVASKEKIEKSDIRLKITIGSEDQWLKSAEKVRAAFERANMKLDYELVQGVKHDALEIYGRKGLEMLKFHASAWKDEKHKPLFEVK